MPFEKGHEKMGGRDKGTPNKKTAEVKQAFEDLLHENKDNVISWLEAIEDPAKRLEMLDRFAKYIIPALARQEIQAEVSQKKSDLAFEIEALRKDATKPQTD